MAEGLETIRWPTNLDRAAIEERLGKVKAGALELGLSDIAERFTSVSAMSAAQVASNVVVTLTWLLNQPEHSRASYEAITKQLEMIALNLKNLK